MQNSQENTCEWVSFLIKLQTSNQQLYEHKTLAQSCDFCETFKSTVFFFFFFKKISGHKLLFVTDRCNTFTDVSEQVASELWKYFVKNTYGIINAYNSKIQKRKKLFHRKWENYIFQFACVSLKSLLPQKNKNNGEYKIISSMWNLNYSREILVFEECI